MRRAVVALAATVLGLVLLFLFKPSGSPGQRAVPAVPSPGPQGPASRGTTSPGPVALPRGRHTVTGDLVSTEFGPVQVQVTIIDGRIAAVSALHLPDALPLDRDISGPAAVQLERAVIAAQSAVVHTVSGATYTSEGYLRSLQSALDTLRR
jgi:uncharacterized protein with FMN-binding domain